MRRCLDQGKFGSDPRISTVSRTQLVHVAATEYRVSAVAVYQVAGKYLHTAAAAAVFVDVFEPVSYDTTGNERRWVWECHAGCPENTAVSPGKHLALVCISSDVGCGTYIHP